MPRLPGILLNQGVAAPEGPRIPNRLPESPALGIAQAGRAASETLLDIGQQQYKEANQEAGVLAADYEQRVGIANVQLKATQRNPDAYVDEYEKLQAQTLDDVAKTAQNPQSAALMRKHLAHVLARNRIQANEYAQGLRKDQSIARTDEVLDSRKTLAGVAESDTDFQRHVQEGYNAITLATPDIGADKAGDMKRKFTQDVLGARAYREAHEDPNAFLETADTRFQLLDPKHREELKQHARTQSETERKNRNAEWEKWYDRVEKEAEEERKSQLTGLEAAALKGQLTVQRLDDAKAMRIVTTREEYAALYKAATDQKELPSDKAALLDASMKAHRTVPAITQAQLDTLYRDGKLNRQDWKELKDKVIARGDHLKAEGESEKTKTLTQGEQVLGRALGISSLYDKIDDQDKQLYDIGLRELTARSFTGNENAVDVANEIVNRFAPIRQERLKLKVQDVGKTLMFPAQDAATAMANLNAKRTTLPPGVIAQEERKIADMTRAEGFLFDANAKKKPEQGGQKNMGRKPGEKPKTGTAE